MSVSFERKADPGAGAGGGDGAADESVDWHEESVTPLFKLRPGQAASSYGLSCARRSGVPADVVRRAALVSAHMRRHEPLPPLSAGAAAARRDAAALELAELLMATVIGPDVDGAAAARLAELARLALADG
jgi:DNA mismatch repair ATPase MutS